MAFVPTAYKTAEENQQFLLGNAPASGSAIALTEGPDGGASAARSGGQVLGTTPQTAQAEPQQLSGSTFVPQGGTLTERLTSGVRQGAEALGGTLSGERQGFYELAGPRRSFESIGAAGTIEQGLAPGASTAPIVPLLSAEYAGPRGFTDEGVQGFEAGYQDLSARARGLRGGGTLQTLVGQSAPGLSPGEARFESQRLTHDPSYRQAVAPQERQVEELYQRFDRERREAERFAAEREAEERRIADQTRAYLARQEAEIARALESRVARDQAQRQAAEAAYKQFRAAPTAETLQGAQRGLLGFNPANLSTPLQAERERAERLYHQILEKYPTVKGLPLLGLEQNTAGEESYTFPEKITAKQREDLVKRQLELERHFRPHATTGRLDDTAVGRYAPYVPIYFSDSLKDPRYSFPELSRFVDFDPGVAATRENVARPEERERFNKINDLLQEAERLQEAGEAPRAARILARVKDFIGAEKATKSARAKELEALGGAWHGRGVAQHEAWRKAKKKRAWGKAIGLPTFFAGGLASSLVMQMAAKGLGTQDDARLATDYLKDI